MLLNLKSILLILVGLYSLSATASSGELLQLMDMLRENRSLSQKQYDSLLATIEDRETNQNGGLHVTTQGGLELSSYDGQFSFEMAGRLMVDMAAYQQDKVALGNGTELRRARFELEGLLYSNWGYELGVDFAGGDADIKDAYIEHLGEFNQFSRLGQFKEPFSLEELTSSRYITFMERALPNEFAPGRHIGLGYYHRGEYWTAAYGLFGEAFDDGDDNEGDEGWGVSGRFSYAPWKDDRKALHLGLALSQRWSDDDNQVKYNSRPESHITDVKYLDTGDIANVDHVLLSGLEAAVVLGSLSIQGEIISAQLDRYGAQEELNFSGWYAYVSWFLTGESRKYKVKKGAFGRIKPGSEAGAWELALRLSSMDLNDKDINGGEAEQMTLGINWYVNPHIRYMFNFVVVDNDLAADADGDTDGFGVVGDDDPSILQLRAQIDF